VMMVLLLGDVVRIWSHTCICVWAGRREGCLSALLRYFLYCSAGFAITGVGSAETGTASSELQTSSMVEAG